MFRNVIISLLYLLFCLNNLQAQVLNNFTTINTTPGTTLYVNGSSFNDASATLKIDALGISAELVTNDMINNGILEGSGQYRIKGNWLNNNIYNSGTGYVSMEGNSQIIGGNNSSYFYNLTLLGSGNITQTNNQFVLNTLDLTEKELLTGNFSMTILNTNTNAIQRTTGFVSSTNTGYLARKTALATNYLFPVGSSLGVLRYRPVEIEPQNTDTSIYTIRMANIDATSEGFDRNFIHTEICNTNPLFYHRINRTFGNTPVDLSIYFDEILDGNWDGISNWTNLPLWQAVIGSSVITGFPMSKAVSSNWNNFTTTPYILYSKNISINLGNDTVLCAGNSLLLDAGSGYDSYLWSNAATTQTISVNTTNSYSVTVTKGSCSQSDTINVIFILLPSVNLGNDTTICSGNILRLNAGSGYATYIWNTSDTSSFIDISAAGTYTVTVTDSAGCTGLGTITISTISYNASIDYVGDLCHDATPITLTAADAGGVWSGTGITNPLDGIFDPVLAGIGQHIITYAISVQCGDTGTITVNVINCEPYEPHAVVPDIFSPNGDGENDVLYVRGEGIKTLYFAVYTRWGEKVFDTTDKNKGWNGTYKDKPLDPAVFVYHLFVLLENDKEIKIKGDVTLVR